MGFNIKALCDLGSSDTIESGDIGNELVEVSDPEGTSDGKVDCKDDL